MPIEQLTNIKVGYHNLEYTPNGGSMRNLGWTQEGSVITVKPTYVERTVHELGDTPHDIIINGYDVQVALILKSASLDNIVESINAVKTTVAGSPTKVSGDLDPRAGLSVGFGKMRLHPRKLADNNVTEDWTIHKALCMSEGNFSLKANEDLTVTWTFKAGVWQDGTTGAVKILTFGDPTTAKDFLA